MNIALFLALAGCILMVLLPDIALLSAQKGIALWAGSVLPALLPFFICVGFLNSLGITDYLPRGLFIFTMSVLAGYPMGARLIGEMVRKGEIDTRQARRLISFGSTSGPTFLLGAVGAGMLGSVTAGIVIAVSHYIGALLTGLLFCGMDSLRKTKKRSSDNRNAFSTEAENKMRERGVWQKGRNNDLFAVFTDSILGALKSLGIVLAYIVLFMFITDLIQFSGLLNFFDMPQVKALIKGFLEMTVGCAAISRTMAAFNIKILFCTFLVSFGGISVIGQSMSMLAGSGISFKYFIAVKLCHGVASCGVALLCLFFI